MQFVILKDDYEVDEYGIEIKQEEIENTVGILLKQLTPATETAAD